MSFIRSLCQAHVRSFIFAYTFIRSFNHSLLDYPTTRFCSGAVESLIAIRLSDDRLRSMHHKCRRRQIQSTQPAHWIWSGDAIQTLNQWWFNVGSRWPNIKPAFGHRPGSAGQPPNWVRKGKKTWFFFFYCLVCQTEHAVTDNFGPGLTKYWANDADAGPSLANAAWLT